MGKKISQRSSGSLGLGNTEKAKKNQSSRSFSTTDSITHLSVIEQIKEELSIIDALERYTNANLTRAKTNRKQFNICCPLHDERHPSFTVYTDTNRWICWSQCGTGDVIDLVAKTLNISTAEAIKRLAKDLGIKGTPSKEMVQKIERKQYIRLNLKEFEQHKDKAFRKLILLKDITNRIIRSIETIEDLDVKGDAYHAREEIEYYLDLLESEDIENQMHAIRGAERVEKKWF
jgi:hypothetical protein